MTEFNDLNYYCFENIIKSFTLKEIFQLRLVCLHWKSFINEYLSRRKSLVIKCKNGINDLGKKSLSCDDAVYFKRNKEDYFHPEKTQDESVYLKTVMSKCYNVTSLSLQNIYFEDKIMKMILNQLPDVQCLDLSHSGWLTTEQQVDFINQFKSLERLILSNAQIYSFYEKPNPKLIIRNANLKHVNLKGFNMQNMESFFKEMGKQLTELIISYEYFYHKIKLYQHLNKEKLKHLQFDYIKGSFSLNNFSGFVGLQVLIINEIHNKHTILSMNYLEYQYNHQHNFPHQLNDETMLMLMKGCPNMKVFEYDSFGEQYKVTNYSMQQIDKLWPNLTRLTLKHFTQITSKTMYSIANLENLTYLFLSNADIDDDGIIRVLVSCKQLSYFSFHLNYPYQFRFGFPLTNEILTRCIEVAQERPLNNLTVEVVGARLIDPRLLCVPDHLKLIIKNRKVP